VLTDSKDINQLMLVVQGTTFTLYVNGQRTGTFSDTSHTSGSVALEMSTFEDSAVTNCTFTNTWLWDLSVGSTTDLPTIAPVDTGLPTKTPIGTGGETTPVVVVTNTPSTTNVTTATVTINVPSANLRSGPGTDFPRVETAEQGDTFPVIARAGSGQETWYLVQLSGNREAWVWSGIVTLTPSNADIPLADNVVSPATPVPNVTTGQAPVITNVVAQGSCDDLTLVVTWSDPDGDAIQLEWLDGDTGTVAYTDPISGSGGTFPSQDWYCESASCTQEVRAVDAAGHTSNVFESSVTCPGN
jgi:uncharacterized protein YgiM (DUF1202 family)